LSAWQAGASSAAKCLGGKQTSSGGQAEFEASMCEQVTNWLTHTHVPVMEGMQCGVCINSIAEHQLDLQSYSTAPFLAVLHARGLSEVEAVAILSRALLSYFDSVESAFIFPCSFLPGGKGTNKFWDWWSPSAFVRVGFDSLACLEEAESRIAPSFFFDAATRAESLLVVRIHFQQRSKARRDTNNVQLGLDHKSKTYTHALLSNFNSHALKGAQRKWVLQGKTVEAMQESLRQFLLPFGYLPEGAVEFIMGVNGKWDWAKGIRVYCTAAFFEALRKALQDGVSTHAAHPKPFTILPTQPAKTLTCVIKNPGVIWEPLLNPGSDLEAASTPSDLEAARCTPWPRQYSSCSRSSGRGGESISRHRRHAR
jgi:hypothetical protein